MSDIYRNFAMDFKNEPFRNTKIDPLWHEAKQKNLEIKTC